MDNYVLNANRSVTKMTDLIEWATRFGQDNRVVAKTEHGGITVSTVFLGIDHNLGSYGPPLLFETMVFGGLRDGQTYRCSTYLEAERTHGVVCWCVWPSNDHSSSSSSEDSGDSAA